MTNDIEWRLRRIKWIMDTPIQLKTSYSCIDDLCMRPKVFMLWLRFVFKIFFRLWPFYLRLSFPTRTALIRQSLTGERRDIWMKPLISIGTLR